MKKTTKEILIESFRELSEQKAIDKITIKEITDNCGYSPATFYRQFKDKYDMIAYDYTLEIKALQSRFDGSEQSRKQSLIDVSFFFQNNKEYLSNLFIYTSGYDSFVVYMEEKNLEIFTIIILNSCKEIDGKTSMLVRSYVLGTIQITCQWTVDNLPVDAKTMAEIYDEALPEAIRHLMFQKLERF